LFVSVIQAKFKEDNSYRKKTSPRHFHATISAVYDVKK